ncbi:MAG: Uma2 family endonuclease [Isosphaeraceae bacterium]
MNAATASPKITPEALLAMPDRKSFELVGGKLVGRKSTSLASWTAGQLLFQLRLSEEGRRREYLFGPDLGYRCFRDDPDRVRRPDVSYVNATRLPEGLSDDYMTIAPDLAVEVLTPDDLASEVHLKIREYFDAGVRAVWVVDPVVRVAQAFRAGGGGSWLSEHDRFDGEDVLPGFSCPVSAIFPPRKAVPTGG